MDYEYFGTPYGLGLCNLQSEKLRMELLETALILREGMEEEVSGRLSLKGVGLDFSQEVLDAALKVMNESLCLAHVKILSDHGNGRSAFNMLLHYQIEGQIPWEFDE
jgi:hypothetical protein